jgi:hypothetical protein
MPRTDTARTRTTRVLAVAGAAAALAGAGTAAATAASAATVPAGLTPGHSAALTPGHTTLSPATASRAAKTARPAKAEDVAKTARAAKHTVTTARHEHAVRHEAPTRPYQMYDSVTPSAIPGGKAVATYADGPYAATPSQLTGRHVTWIDTNGTDPKGATVLDVEPGDATPAGAATWAAQRLNAHPANLAVIYTMRSEWPATQAAISTLPHWQQHHIRYWIADPTGVPHVIPGSSATQWYWGTHYDISTVNPGF